MRTSKVFAGTVLLAALVLTGCSGGNSEAPETATPLADASEAATPTAEASASAEATTGADEVGPCPTLSVGASFEASELSACAAAAVTDVAGYAATSTTMGFTTSMKLNPAERELQVDMAQMGEVIVVGGKTYVRTSGGEWLPGDVNSTDPIIAGLSAAGDSEEIFNPTALTGDATGTLTVTGTDTRLGKEVYVITGTQTTEGNTSDVTYYITSDWETLESNVVSEISGQKIDVTVTVTEWDVKQNIVAPI